MTARTTIIIAVGAIAVAVALWMWLGPEYAAAPFAPLAVAAARKVRRAQPPPPAPSVEDDEAVDAMIVAAAKAAAEAAADDASSGWGSRPVRSRPRLDLALLLCLLPVGVRAEPAITDGCVDVGTYGPHAARAGFGMWREQGREMLCPCLPGAAYGDVTRIPAGCPAAVPVLGYSVKAHAATVADMARARLTVGALRDTLNAARAERDRQAHAAALAFEDAQASLSREVALVARLAAQEQATAAAKASAKAAASDWWTWRSVVLSSVAIIAGGGAVYVTCRVAGG